MQTDCLWKQPRWRLLVFHRAMAMLSAALVISALIVGVYRQRAYFAFAACALGTLQLARAWWDDCRRRDRKPCAEKPAQVPWMLRRTREKRRYKPAFLMDSRDFDDDLTACTAVSADGFSEDQCRLAQIAAELLSGALMILISFI